LRGRWISIHAISFPDWVDANSGVKLAKGEVKTRDGMALKSHAQLKALYADLDPNKETIVYCQSSGRACITPPVLRIRRSSSGRSRPSGSCWRRWT